jgi:hypothetical protein
VQAHARGDRAQSQHGCCLGHREPVERDELEHRALTLGELRDGGEQLARMRRGIDALLHALQVVVAKQAAALHAGVGTPLASDPPVLGRDDDPRDAEQPCGRTAALAPVPGGCVDGGEEDLGGEIRREVGIGDALV